MPRFEEFCRTGQTRGAGADTVGDFLDRLFGGDPIPLMQYLAEHGKINADDIEMLKRLTDKK